MKGLTNKVAVVTGGNSGIGYATAKVLKEQGADVIITGRRKEAVEAAGQALGVTAMVSDQGKVADIEVLAENIKQQYSKIDILFINAGILGGAAIEDAAEEVFDSVMNVNFKGAYFTLSRFIPLLNEGAAVVFLSSNTAHMNRPNSSIYSSSKSALNAIMRTAAMELAPRKIRVNAVSPGPIETPILAKQGLSDQQLKDLQALIISEVPLHHMGKPEDVGKMVAHLCSPEANFITGAEFVMDGGMSVA
ncbi:SDR family oxidoreductase [Chitinophaga sp. Cy-1792]|uniref:SDR family oxidoreductase n=1 Tax=Chitinophaga sp. Cy-1792 TaxID=2608339 RepID=UPI00142404D5|nr:SDR family oxidoreductase [Chitinophaga sp. Cy-1792]NIG51871.1 SDR family oxidoreductase [Chitinophaga sp. Cy-1792]